MPFVPSLLAIPLFQILPFSCVELVTDTDCRAFGSWVVEQAGQLQPCSVKAGDRVLLPGWGGNSIKVGEEVRTPFPLFLFPGGYRGRLEKGLGGEGVSGSL